MKFFNCNKRKSDENWTNPYQFIVDTHAKQNHLCLMSTVWRNSMIRLILLFANCELQWNFSFNLQKKRKIPLREKFKVNMTGRKKNEGMRVRTQIWIGTEIQTIPSTHTDANTHLEKKWCEFFSNFYLLKFSHIFFFSSPEQEKE